MTETAHLIFQAAHEIGITRDQGIAVVEGDGNFTVTFKNRRGDSAEVTIPMDADFKTIHAEMKSAWKGKTVG